ncbi:helix-turn-helix domain-containing protein [Hamadaea tsunoensis]|uniref:helix-turn-helix domain-containing protein n=1 Tax=Hamadaea tsunoensis TaxID=53368 RepID=UPI000480BC0A|nr:XRE family transcriptional regulator [Hamadaea tsunoensis]
MDTQAIGERLRALRRARHLTLEQLAAASGVSRSMLSDVERGGRTPTVLTLDRIATGLGTSIARLLQDQHQDGRRQDGQQQDGQQQDGRQQDGRHGQPVVLRHADQQVARDPAGWERRILSPVLPGVEFEFMRTTIGGGVDAGEFAPHAAGSREYVAVEAGTLRLTLDGEPVDLRAGDSAYFAGDRRHGFANPGAEDCVYYLAMDVDGHRSEG